MSKHTPGPWTSRPFGDSFAVMVSDKRVAYCYGAFADWDKETAEANAHLIAAAPELLEALKEMCEMHGGIHDEDCPEDDTCGCYGKAFNDRINAVIAKAEGREVK